MLLKKKIEETRRRGRRVKQLPDDLKEKRRHCNLKAEAFFGELALE
jgi:hypothetical protein